VTGRRVKRRRKLLDDVKESREYSHLKEEAQDLTVWRAGFGRGLGAVVRQTIKIKCMASCFYNSPACCRLATLINMN
jgi:hypothetical protein